MIPDSLELLRLSPLAALRQRRSLRDAPLENSMLSRVDPEADLPSQGSPEEGVV